MKKLTLQTYTQYTVYGMLCIEYGVYSESLKLKVNKR